MNIKQALKRKNKLAGKLKQLFTAMHANNSVVAGSNRSYDSLALFEEANQVMSELVSLKTKIHVANAPIANLIFEASELKNVVQNLKVMKCDNGRMISYRSDNPVEYEATITERKRDEMVSMLEDRLEEINDQLDQFNAITQIEE